MTCKCGPMKGGVMPLICSECFKERKRQIQIEQMQYADILRDDYSLKFGQRFEEVDPEDEVLEDFELAEIRLLKIIS